MLLRYYLFETVLILFCIIFVTTFISTNIDAKKHSFTAKLVQTLHNTHNNDQLQHPMVQYHNDRDFQQKNKSANTLSRSSKNTPSLSIHDGIIAVTSDSVAVIDPKNQNELKSMRKKTKQHKTMSVFAHNVIPNGKLATRDDGDNDIDSIFMSFEEWDQDYQRRESELLFMNLIDDNNTNNDTNNLKQEKNNNVNNPSYSKQLSVFERLAIYNNYVKSKVRSELDKHIIKRKPQFQQGCADGGDCINNTDKKTIADGGNNGNNGDNTTNIDQNSISNQHHPHRSLQTFTTLSLQNNPHKHINIATNKPDNGYKPSRIVKTFNSEQISQLPPLSLSMIASTSSRIRPISTGSNKLSSKQDKKVKTMSTSSSSSPVNPQNLDNIELSHHISHSIDLQRHDDIFSPRFYLQKTLKSARNNVTPNMYHHYQGYLTTTQTVSLHPKVKYDGELNNNNSDDNGDEEGIIDAFRSNNILKNRIRTFMVDDISHHHDNNNVKFDLNAHLFTHDNLGDLRAQNMKNKHLDNSNNATSDTAGAYSKPSETNNNDPVKNQANEMTNEQKRSALLKKLQDVLSQRPYNPSQLKQRTTLLSNLSDEYDSDTTIVDDVIDVLFPGLIDTQYDETLIKRRDTNCQNGQEYDSNGVKCDLNDDYADLIDILGLGDENGDNSEPMTFVHNRVFNLAVSIHPNGTLTGQAVDDYGMYSFTATLIRGDNDGNNNSNDDEHLNGIDNKLFDYSPSSFNRLLDIDGQWDIKLELDQPLPHHNHHDHDHNEASHTHDNDNHHHHPNHGPNNNKDHNDSHGVNHVDHHHTVKPLKATNRSSTANRLRKIRTMATDEGLEQEIDDGDNNSNNNDDNNNIDQNSQDVNSSPSSAPNDPLSTTNTTNPSSNRPFYEELLVDKPRTCGNPSLPGELKHFFAHPDTPFVMNIPSPTSSSQANVAQGNISYSIAHGQSNQGKKLTKPQQRLKFEQLLDNFYQNHKLGGLNHVINDEISKIDQKLQKEYKLEQAALNGSGIPGSYRSPSSLPGAHIDPYLVGYSDFAPEEDINDNISPLTQQNQNTTQNISFNTFAGDDSPYPIKRGVIELGVANDYWRVQSIGGPDGSDLYNSAARLVNVADSLYNRASFDPPLRVVVGLIVNPMETIDSPIDINLADESGTAVIADANQYLDAFMSWSTYNLNIDAKVMLSGLGIRGSVIGLAVLSRMCQSSSSGMVEAQYTSNESFVGTVLAHEVGHMLGLLHDMDNEEVDDNATGNSVKCPTDNKNIMGATASRPPSTIFSQCSHAYYHNWITRSNYATCLEERNHHYEGSVCGNGILEVGESCDCGSPSECQDQCCDASSCQLKPGPEYQCSDQSSPCCKNCKIITTGENKICRPASNVQCDLPEYCDGFSSQCPLNIVQPTGTQCTITASVEDKDDHNPGADSIGASKDTFDFAGLCYKGLCYSWEYTCAKYGGIPCPYQTSQEQCLNSKCLLYTKDPNTSSLKDCFDPFAIKTGDGGGNGNNGQGANEDPDQDNGDNNGGEDEEVPGKPIIPPNVTPTTPNGIPCANNLGQCLQFQCLATTSGDSRVVRPPNAVVFGIPAIGVAILCCTIALIIAIIVVCVILKRRRAKILKEAVNNEMSLSQPPVNDARQFTSPRGARLFHQAVEDDENMQNPANTNNNNDNNGNNDNTNQRPRRRRGSTERRSSYQDDNYTNDSTRRRDSYDFVPNNDDGNASNTLLTPVRRERTRNNNRTNDDHMQDAMNPPMPLLPEQM